MSKNKIKISLDCPFKKESTVANISSFQIKIFNPNLVKLQKFHLQREKYITHHVKTFVQLQIFYFRKKRQSYCKYFSLRMKIQNSCKCFTKLRISSRLCNLNWPNNILPSCIWGGFLNLTSDPGFIILQVFSGREY